MNQSNKIEIVESLERYITQKGSQNKVANEMQGVSAATLSQIRNHNWENIADEMWRKISAFLGINANTWKMAETTNTKILSRLFNEAQLNSLVMAVVANAGTGKTATAKLYDADNSNVFRLSCNEYWDKKCFLKEILNKMGKEGSGMRIYEMMDKAVMTLKATANPLIILDEADKLPDNVFLFFITLYNKLEDHAGIVLMATDALERRIIRGESIGKKGYKEIYSRLGRRFIELEQTSAADVKAICKANGITDERSIQSIAKDCEADIRRVKRLVIAKKRAS